jgi:CRISPR/Cas system CMR-associated protein Cmr1 (group 7 of RAMP superfamily)
MNRQTIELLTPCFCGGAWPRKEAELRVPSLRGQLHFWARLLHHSSADPKVMARDEQNLLGGVNSKLVGIRQDAIASPFVPRLELRSRPDNARERADVCPHDPSKRDRPAIPAGSKFDLTWTHRISAGNGAEAAFQRVLKVWLLLGGLGARVNRAGGSVWPVWPAGEPTIDQFLALVSSLSLPPTVLVKVLPSPSSLTDPTARAVWGAWEKRHRQLTEAETLRAIAGDIPILSFEAKRYFRITGDPFGHARRGGRQASPLKLKVGRFTENNPAVFRLIAVADDRDGRGSSRPAAVQALCCGYSPPPRSTDRPWQAKPLGFLLQEAGF